MVPGKGSSPHARGRADDAVADAAEGGFIPACAGERTGGHPSRATIRVHPRMRGGEVQLGTANPLLVGSSPHARGRVLLAPSYRNLVGFIPACAGERPGQGDELGQVGVHPRMRGGEASAEASPYHNRGSSPHARGRGKRGSQTPGDRGFIPACAGESRALSKRRSEVGVHPRMRGGEPRMWPWRPTSRGSSPHARGRAGHLSGRGPSRGFIPACAGERRPPSPGRRTAGVHPRMRGGETTPWLNGVPVRGSSPHARGRGPPGTGRRVDGGFIPACAGESRSARAGSPGAGVHPRMRGGEDQGRGVAAARQGSSPHARGRGRGRAPGRACRGFIPACAGERHRPASCSWTTRVHPRMRGGESSSATARPCCSGSSPHARGRVGLRARPGFSDRVHPRMRGGESSSTMLSSGRRGSSPHARGRALFAVPAVHPWGFIPACAGERATG